MTEAAPSPFLPGTKIQFAWDSTSLGWLKTCPRLYQYSMIEGWRAKGSHVHLVFGQHYHAALELYDKLRLESLPGEALNHDDALQAVVRKVMIWTWERDPGSGPDVSTDLYRAPVSKPWDSGHPSKTRETLIRSIIWYLDQFKDDPAKTVVLANGKPAVELSFRMEMEWGPPSFHFYEASTDDPTLKRVEDEPQPYILCGHLDRVVEFNSQRYVMDRKTTGSALSPYYFDNFSPDNQMSIYTIAAKVQFQTPVAGVIIDAAQILVGFTRFQRGFTYRTDAVLEEWLADFRQWTDLAEHYAENDHWPQNDKACGLYGGCTFRGICSKSPEVREKFLESDYERQPWNPLKSR